MFNKVVVANRGAVAARVHTGIIADVLAQKKAA